MQVQHLYLFSFVLAFVYAFYKVFCKTVTKQIEQLPKQHKISSNGQSKFSKKTQKITNLETKKFTKLKQQSFTSKIEEPVDKFYSNLTKSKQKQTQSAIVEQTDFNFFNVVKKYVQQQKSQKVEDDNNLKQIKQLNSYLQGQSELIEAYSEAKIVIEKQNKKQARKERQRRRILALKDHYKKIITQLKQKLQAVCIRNNQSFDAGQANETITFTEDSMLSDLNIQQDEGVKVRIQDVYNLQQQLQFQEQMLTNILEEDRKLKQKLEAIQSQNNTLKKSRISEYNAFTESEKLKEITRNFQEENLDSHLINQPKTQRKPQVSSHQNLYASQIVYNKQMPTNLLYSRAQVNPASFSTISMISIIQGAISIGLLSQCRFLNQISKKYIITEIKKTIKKKVIDSEMIYTNAQNFKNQQPFSTYLRDQSNLLILIKLINGKTISSFIQTPIYFTQEVYEQDKEGHIILIDSGLRKKLQSRGRCFFEDQCLIWGDRQFILKQSLPITVSSESIGSLVTTKQKAVQLFGSENIYQSTVQLLYIYTLTSEEYE